MIRLSDKNLKPLWALEIKWSDRYASHPGELKSVLKFCADNNLEEAYVTSITKNETIQLSNLKLHFIPASVYAYSVGAMTLMQKDV
jgi:hypothetical protein